MNDPHPIDENEFAERLEQVEEAAQKDESVNIESPAIEDAAQKEKFDGAAQVIGMIHRARRSKAASTNETAVHDTDAEKLDTPRQDINDNVPIEAIDVDGAAPKKIGRFQIKSQLGQGGYGLVFLAHDPQLDRDVALKVPRAEAFVDSSTRTRFIREAKSAAGLNHANIVPVFEAGQFGPICYIASAYCPGKSLGQWVLNREQPVTWLVAADWLMTLADAVQHAHSRGIVHRDLKPDNILVEIESESKTDESSAAPLLRITDFGLAKDLDDQSDLTRSGSVVGTPSYISPEQTDSKFGSPNQLVDIYGLGAILYFVLCKVPPISGNSLLDTIKKVQEQPPVPPRKIRPEIPRDLEAICLKCLEKHPRHRYQSASELQSDLLRFRDGLPIQARRPSAMDRALMWCRRRPAVSALAASLLVVLAVSSIALVFLLARSNSLKKLSDANAEKATESAAIATVERDRSREALQAMTSGVASNWLGSQRKLTSEQKAFLETTVNYYREFAAGNTDDPSDQFWVAQAERRLAQLFSRLGQFDDAISSSDRAIMLLEQISPEWEPSVVLLELAETLHGKYGTLTRIGKSEDALPVAQLAVEIARELVGAAPENMRARKLLSEVVGNLGSRYQKLGHFDESLAATTESVMTLEQLLLEHPDDRSIKRSLGINCMNLGNLLARMKRMPESREKLERSLKLRTELVDAEPDSAIFQFDLSYALGNLAAVAYRMNEFDNCVAFSERAAKIGQRLVEQYPIEERYRRNLIGVLNNLSGAYNTMRNFEKSNETLVESISMSERSIRDFPKVPIYRVQLAMGKSKLATALAEQGKHQEAIAYHDEAILQLREMIEHSVETPRAIRMMESALTNRATALGYVNRHDDAIDDWDALIEITRPDEVNTIWLCRATSLVKKGDIDAALADVDRVLAETMELPKEKRNFLFFYNAACVHSLVSARVDDENKSREHALRAIELLQQAIDAGLSPISHVRADPELEPLHSYPEYQAIVKE